LFRDPTIICKTLGDIEKKIIQLLVPLLVLVQTRHCLSGLDVVMKRGDFEQANSGYTQGSVQKQRWQPCFCTTRLRFSLQKPGC